MSGIGIGEKNVNLCSFPPLQFMNGKTIQVLANYNIEDSSSLDVDECGDGDGSGRGCEVQDEIEVSNIGSRGGK